MTDQPTSLRDVISGLVSITHSEKMKKEFLDAAEEEILTWIKAKDPKQEAEKWEDQHGVSYVQGFKAGVTAFLEALEEQE